MGETESFYTKMAADRPSSVGVERGWCHMMHIPPKSYFGQHDQWPDSIVFELWSNLCNFGNQNGRHSAIFDQIGKKSPPCSYPSAHMSLWEVTQKSILDAFSQKRNFLSFSKSKFLPTKIFFPGNCLKRPQNILGEIWNFRFLTHPILGVGPPGVKMPDAARLPMGGFL